MAKAIIHCCACPACQTGEDHPDRALHHQINLVMSRLDEQQRRCKLLPLSISSLR